jgi:hypothetical protein
LPNFLCSGAASLTLAQVVRMSKHTNSFNLCICGHPRSQQKDVLLFCFIIVEDLFEYLECDDISKQENQDAT